MGGHGIAAEVSEVLVGGSGATLLDIRVWWNVTVKRPMNINGNVECRMLLF